MIQIAFQASWNKVLYSVFMKLQKSQSSTHYLPHLFLSNTSAWNLYFLCPCWIYAAQKSTLALSIRWKALAWKGASDGQTSGEVTGERATDHSNSSRPSMVSWHPSTHRSHQSPLPADATVLRTAQQAATWSFLALRTHWSLCLPWTSPITLSDTVQF